MLNIVEHRREFMISCPYCNSKIKVKAGHKLKFKNYIYNKLDDPYHQFKYLKIPTWKCKICKNKFALNMEDEAACTIEDLPKSSVADKYYVVQRTIETND